jgi:hypothetical protein
MRRSLASLALGFAWLCANGALLDTMQVVAWGRMFAGYAETMPVGAALRETLDPRKPCAMCVRIAHAKETAKQQMPGAVERAAEKLVLALNPETTLVFVPPPVGWPAAAAETAPRRVEPVPVPPPRV